MTITKATASDIPELRILFDKATQYKLLKGDTGWGQPGWTDDEVASMMDLHKGTYIARTDDAVLAGTISIDWSDERIWGTDDGLGCYIHKLASNQDFDGVGLMLIKWSEDFAKSHGKKYLRLDCDSTATGLCKYYVRNGFKQIRKTNTGDYAGPTALLQKQI